MNIEPTKPSCPFLDPYQPVSDMVSVEAKTTAALKNAASDILRDSPFPPMTDHQKKCLLTSIAHKEYTLLIKYLNGDDLSAYPELPLDPTVEQDFRVGMKSLIHSFLPDTEPISTYFAEIDEAREQIRRGDFIGTDNKVRNALAGPPLQGITDPALFSEGALRTPEKFPGERLERYQSFEPRSQNFDPENPCKGFAFCLRGFSTPTFQPEFEKRFSSFEGNDTEVSVASTQGRRPHMEDTHAATSVTIQGKEIPFFALFDGHGGIETAEFLEKNIQPILQQQLSLLKKPLDKAAPSAIENILTGLPVKMEQERRKTHPKKDTSGATFTLVIPLLRKIFVANAGDSRVVALQGEKTIQLTEDASANSLPFQKGVIKRGGTIKAGRVNGDLAVARAVGDTDVPGITPRAKVTWLHVSSDEQIVIIGCDGLFESTTSQTIADEYRSKKTAKALPTKAFDWGSEDNITAMVVKIQNSALAKPPASPPFSPLDERVLNFFKAAISCGNFTPFTKFMRGKQFNIGTTPIPDAAMELKFLQTMQSFIHSPIPQGTIWGAHFAKVRELYRQQEFTGTEDKIDNALAGPFLFDIYRRSEGALHTHHKTLEGLERWKTDPNFKIDNPPRKLPFLPAYRTMSIHNETYPFTCIKPNDTQIFTANYSPKSTKTLFSNTIEVQKEKIPYFAFFVHEENASLYSIDTELPWFLDNYLSPFLSEHFALLGRPLSQATLNQIKNCLAVLPVKFHQQWEADRGRTKASVFCTIAICINGAIWILNVGCNRTLALVGPETYQLTEDALPTTERFRRGIEKRNGPPLDDPFWITHMSARSICDISPEWITRRAKVTRMPFPDHQPLTLIIGSSNLFNTLTSEEIGDEYRDTETPEALIQKALESGSRGIMSAAAINIGQFNTLNT